MMARNCPVARPTTAGSSNAPGISTMPGPSCSARASSAMIAWRLAGLATAARSRAPS
jgi:hypothetical protein